MYNNNYSKTFPSSFVTPKNEQCNHIRRAILCSIALMIGNNSIATNDFQITRFMTKFRHESNTNINNLQTLERGKLCPQRKFENKLFNFDFRRVGHTVARGVV